MVFDRNTEAADVLTKEMHRSWSETAMAGINGGQRPYQQPYSDFEDTAIAWGGVAAQRA